MKIGLIDADGKIFPNLALMRISAYHKQRGDDVGWWMGNLWYYDIVYISKVFSPSYKPFPPDPLNVGQIVKGGTGYCITTDADGREHFDEKKNVSLPESMERMFPDYSIYPEYEFAVSMTSRGCPRGCSFCHVAAKEGRCSRKVADVSAFWNGQKEIKVLDPNITCCREKRDLMQQYIDTGAWIDFTQGIDIRAVNEDDIRDLNRMRIKRVHFAWDNPKDDLEDRFRWFSERFRIKDPGRKTVYCLTNYDSTIEEDLHRIYTLRDMPDGYQPYVMVYNKPDADDVHRRLQRWCNSPGIFRRVKRFEDYDPHNYRSRRISSYDQLTLFKEK